jgi:hypothetical protein
MAIFQTIPAMSPGDLSDFTSSSGNPNWTNLNDANDTTYNSTGAANKSDLFFSGRIAAGAYSIGHVYIHYRQKCAAGSTTEGCVKIGGTVYLDGGPVAGVGAFQDLTGGAWLNNPATAVPWTIADVNALQWGYHTAAVAGGDTVYVSDAQLFVEVNLRDLWTNDADTQLESVTGPDADVRRFLIALGISSDNVTWLETANGQVTYGPVLLPGSRYPVFISLSRSTLVNVYAG